MGSSDVGSVSEIEAEICAIAAAMANQEVRLLQLVGEFDAAEGWRPTGKLSCAHWLAGLLDIDLSTAREKVRVARALRDLPFVRQHFANGTLSYTKVRHLTRVASADNEHELASIAASHPASKLPRILAAWQQRHEPEAAERRRHEERGVSFYDEPTGNRTTVAQLPVDVSATLEVLVDAEVARAPAGASDAQDTLRQRRADALGRLVARLARGDASADASRPLRAELVLHRRVGETTLSDGTVLPKAVARQFTCDADVRVMTHYPNGSPADVGRRHRVVTPRLRRLVLERDGYRCQFPGCDARHFLDVHHIIHWEDGGPTAMANLITYCGYHHRAVHTDDVVSAEAWRAKTA